MKPMNGKQRILAAMNHEPWDEVPACEDWWLQTHEKYVAEGHFAEGADAITTFKYDLRKAGWIESTADPTLGERIVDENDEWKLVKNSNGASLRYWKHQAGTPEHVDFDVRDRESWEKIRPGFVDESLFEKRVDFEGYARQKKIAADNGEFFCWCGVNVFEQMHPICGHEYMLMGMALDPDWICDMVEVLSDLTVKVQKILFERCGTPDGVWFYEDLGFKERPFMSPAMFKELIQPGHVKTFDYAHSLGCPVIVHSCGMVEPLVPTLIESGMDCLQAMEVKAGMSLLRLKEQFGDQIAFCGGLDIRELESNDLGRVEKLLQDVFVPAIKGYNYIFHTDHSIPPSVEYETYKYFLDRGRELSREIGG